MSIGIGKSFFSQKVLPLTGVETLPTPYRGLHAVRVPFASIVFDYWNKT